MNPPLKLLLVAGARPNFMKIAPLVHAIERHNESRLADHGPQTTDHAAGTTGSVLRTPHSAILCKLVHTGQHYDQKMSDIFFQELGIPAPDVNLEVGSGSHAAQTAQVMLKFEPVLLAEKPDWVVVVGDVNSTVACTLVASKLGIKVAHVEAGLRSFDRTMPEEINRLVTDSLADLLLTPSEDANENLRREAVPEHKIKLVGNIMIDSLVANLPAARRSPLLRELGLTRKGFAYVTLHRPANVDHRESLGRIVAALNQLAHRLPVVFPMHPRTRKMLTEFGLSPAANGVFKVLEPVGYLDSLALTENARVVVTDSGGLQEESTYFRTPCLTLRPNTERPVTIEVGSNRLTDAAHLPQHLQEVLAREPLLGQVPPLWDGEAAGRIVQTLIEPAW